MKVKRNRKIKIWPFVLGVLGSLCVMAVAAFVLCRTRAYEIEGNSYYSDNTIRTWIENDELSYNTLGILVRYNLMDAELPAGVEKLHVSLKNPWTVKIKVEEKEMAGYVKLEDAYLYFDGEGTVLIRSKKLIEGVPYIEGLEYDASKAAVGSPLPVEDDGIFGRIVELSRNLKKYELTPDRVTCADGDMKIYFGIVEVLLGTGDYEEKLRQVEPILAKLQELYPETAGTLHLENYKSDSDSIRFVPAE